MLGYSRPVGIKKGADIPMGAKAALSDLLKSSESPARPQDADGDPLPMLPLDLPAVAKDGDKVNVLPAIEPEKRGTGRPKGASNKSTEKWRRYITERYGHPLEVLASLYAQPLEQLAERLGCSRLEAWQEQRHAASALLPYMAQRMPLELVTDGDLPMLMLFVSGQAVDQPASPAADSTFSLDAETVQYQQVIDMAPAASDAPLSDVQDKRLISQRNSDSEP